jgi:uncharacterized protein (DUF433 family)
MKPSTLIRAKRAKAPGFIMIDRGILGGEPVFRGTRVPVATLFEHLESNGSLDEFLENFPSVNRAAAVGVLMLSHKSAVAKARR